MRLQCSWRIASAFLLLTSSSFAAGIINFSGGNGILVFGVTNYGGGPQGAPAYIANNFSGINDILATPGGAFQLANPVVGNNTSQFGPGPLPGWGAQIGGGNVNGAFGAGIGQISGPQAAMELTDSAPAGGSASYGIESWTADFTVGAGGFNGTLGTYLGIAGTLPAVGSASVASLRTRFQINAGPVVDLAQLILAISGNGNFVALGGPAGANAVMQFNGAGYRGLAVNNLGNFVLNQGDVIHTLNTLTAFADPAQFDVIDLPTDLLDLTGAGAPDLMLIGTESPEPGTLALLGLGLAALAIRRKRAA